MGKSITQACIDALRAETELVMLGLTIWREARGQNEECQRGVAYSIINRTKRPSWWNDKRANDICSVVFRRLQYSSLTYKKDPQLTTWPDHSNDPVWLQCLQVAMEAISGISENPVPGADSYYDLSIPAPAWAEPKMFVRQIGRIRFYDVDMDVER